MFNISLWEEPCPWVDRPTAFNAPLGSPWVSSWMLLTLANSAISWGMTQHELRFTWFTLGFTWNTTSKWGFVQAQMGQVQKRLTKMKTSVTLASMGKVYWRLFREGSYASHFLPFSQSLFCMPPYITSNVRKLELLLTLLFGCRMS